jgi:hypothetical protein
MVEFTVEAVLESLTMQNLSVVLLKLLLKKLKKKLKVVLPIGEVSA